MLNGIDPIIIFNFKKNFLDPTAGDPAIPLAGTEQSSFPLPAIPIYLSEKLTGVYVDTEDKSIDIDTSINTTNAASGVTTAQRVINSTVKIGLFAEAGSIGVSLFAAMSDLIIPKITSKEYSITYLHGATVVFAGLLHGFSISQQSGTTLYRITIELVKPSSITSGTAPQVANDPKAATLKDSATAVKR